MTALHVSMATVGAAIGLWYTVSTVTHLYVNVLANILTR